MFFLGRKERSSGSVFFMSLFRNLILRKNYKFYDFIAVLNGIIFHMLTNRILKTFLRRKRIRYFSLFLK